MMKTLVFSFLILAKAYGAKAPHDDLARARTQVMEMGARLSTLEKEIGSKNNLYLSSLEQIKQFETDVKIYRDKLVEIKSDVHKAQEENRHILTSYIIESENESTEAWQKRVHLELLKQAQNKLKAKETELVSFETKVSEFDIKLADLRKNEEELSLVIRELEGRKKQAMDNYLAQVEAKKKVETKVEKKTLTQRLDQVRKTFSAAPVILEKPDRIFAKPVEDFITFVSSAKGVTFKYQAIQPVKAVGQGKVVFAGDLASYGQVVLIDHGGDLRTVLLGRMNIKVKKNDTVQDGEVLAYTVNDTKEAQNLYFEVRKKNTAQNTILWLEQNGVSKI